MHSSADASTSCSKRCRSGAADECPGDLSCFGYTACAGEAVDSTPDTTTNDVPSTVNNEGLRQNYCAKSLADLENSCVTAQTCNNNEPCPSGTYCWGDHQCGEMKESAEVTPSPTNQPMKDPINATSYPVSASPVLGEPAITDAAPDLCPPNYVGYMASADCKDFYECDNSATGPVNTCGDGLSFDKVSTECIAEADVNNFCYGPPLPVVSGSQQQKATTTEAPKNVDLRPCAGEKTGWEASPGCSQYYWCDMGVAGQTFDCGDNLLFDRDLELCNFADAVYCSDSIVISNNNPPPTPTIAMPPPTPQISEQTPSPIMQTTKAPALGKGSAGLNDGYEAWTGTPSPTPQNNTEMPPWLIGSLSRGNDGDSIRLNSLLLVLLPLQLVFG